MSPNWRKFFVFPNENFVFISHLNLGAMCLVHLNFLNVITLTACGKEDKERSSSLCHFVSSPVTPYFGAKYSPQHFVLTNV